MRERTPIARLDAARADRAACLHRRHGRRLDRRRRSEAYEQGDLKQKLARWHDDVDCAFYGWNGAWLDPEFRNWDLTEFLPAIRMPVQVVQGAADQYGTMAQVRAIEPAAAAPVETRHAAGRRSFAAPRGARRPLIDAIARFVRASCAVSKNDR